MILPRRSRILKAKSTKKTTKFSSNTALYTRSKGIQGISQIDEISRNGNRNLKSDRELFELFDRDCILF